jgi:NAD-dependent deacetylase
MKQKLVVFTGAGVSAESGLATFRDSAGLWEGYDPEVVASIEGWRADRKSVLDFYNLRRQHALAAQPNAAHYGLAELETQFDVHILTQNVDDLHERAGSTNVLHLHGELAKMCSSMDKNKTLPYDRDIQLGDKHEDGSQLRPFIVWFGENVPMLDEAIQVARQADIFVVIGTSLQVYPAASLVGYVWDHVPKFLIDKSTPWGVSGIQNLVIIQKPATEGVKELQEKLIEFL